MQILSLQSYDLDLLTGSMTVLSKLGAEHANINIDINIFLFSEIYIILPLVLCCMISERNVLIIYCLISELRVFSHLKYCINL